LLFENELSPFIFRYSDIHTEVFELQ